MPAAATAHWPATAADRLRAACPTPSALMCSHRTQAAQFVTSVGRNVLPTRRQGTDQCSGRRVQCNERWRGRQRAGASALEEAPGLLVGGHVLSGGRQQPARFHSGRGGAGSAWWRACLPMHRAARPHACPGSAKREPAAVRSPEGGHAAGKGRLQLVPNLLRSERHRATIEQVDAPATNEHAAATPPSSSKWLVGCPRKQHRS